MTNKNTDHRRQEVQQTVKSACDQLNVEGVDAGNYVDQLGCFFLKAFDETLNAKERPQFPMLLPSLSDHERIMKKLQITRPLVVEMRTKTAEPQLGLLRQSIMRKAFAGDL
jgi:hypothetical protein